MNIGSPRRHVEDRALPDGVTRLVVKAAGVNVKVRQGTGKSVKLQGSCEADLANVVTKVLGNKLTISNLANNGTVLYMDDAMDKSKFIVNNYGSGVSMVASTIVNHGSINFGQRGIVKQKQTTQSFSMVDVEIELPSVEYLGASGSGNIECLGIQCNEFEVDISGSSKIELDGNVGIFNANISGSGQIKGKSLLTKKANLRVSGSGCISVNVAESVNAHVSGVGEVEVHGKPPNVKKSISGLGTITFK